MLQFDKYKITLTLQRRMLATNPLDANIHDQHVIEKSRKIIEEKNKTNKKIDGWLDELQISKERGNDEVDKIFDRMEEYYGKKFDRDQRLALLAGDLSTLKETIQEVETRGITVFFRDAETGRPQIGDHMIYGFLKASAEALCKTKPRKNGEILHSANYTHGIINQHVRCQEEFIVFDRDLVVEDGKPVHLQRSLRAITAQGPRVSLAKSEVVPAGAKLTFVLKVLSDSPMKEAHLRELFSYGELCGLGQWRNAGWGQFTYEMTKIKS